MPPATYRAVEGAVTLQLRHASSRLLASSPAARSDQGTPFLPPISDDIALDLIETRTFGSRVIYERYGRARDESD